MAYFCIQPVQIYFEMATFQTTTIWIIVSDAIKVTSLILFSNFVKVFLLFEHTESANRDVSREIRRGDPQDDHAFDCWQAAIYKLICEAIILYSFMKNTALPEKCKIWHSSNLYREVQKSKFYDLYLLQLFKLNATLIV